MPTKNRREAGARESGSRQGAGRGGSRSGTATSGGSGAAGARAPRKAPGSMTVREAGRLGGEMRANQLGHEGMAELGHRGGQRVRELIEEGKRAERER